MNAVGSDPTYYSVSKSQSRYIWWEVTLCTMNIRLTYVGTDTSSDTRNDFRIFTKSTIVFGGKAAFSALNPTLASAIGKVKNTQLTFSHWILYCWNLVKLNYFDSSLSLSGDFDNKSIIVGISIFWMSPSISELHRTLIYSLFCK